MTDSIVLDLVIILTIFACGWGFKEWLDMRRQQRREDRRRKREEETCDYTSSDS